MENQGLRELYISELKDIYSAENQMVKALPKLAKASSSTELRQGFENHLDQTKVHVQRLEEIFRSLEESPKGKKCAGMEGLVKEGSEAIQEDFPATIKDAALIGAARRVEHYEIAAYSTVVALAGALGETDHASLLAETLEEEKATDEKLNELFSEVGEANSDEESDKDSHSESAKDQSAKKRRTRAA